MISNVSIWLVLLTSYWTTRGYQTFRSGLYYSHHIVLPQVIKRFNLVCITHIILNYQRLSNVSIWFVLLTSNWTTRGYQMFQSGLYYSNHIELPEVIKRFNLVCITHIILNYQRLSNVSIWFALLTSYWTSRSYQMFQSDLYYLHHIELPDVIKRFNLVYIIHIKLNYQRLSNVSIWFVLLTSYWSTRGYQTFQSGLYYSHHIELPQVIKCFNLVCITHIILNYQRLSNVSIWFVLLTSYWTTRDYQTFQSGLYYSHHIELP